MYKQTLNYYICKHDIGAACCVAARGQHAARLRAAAYWGTSVHTVCAVPLPELTQDIEGVVIAPVRLSKAL